MCGLLTAAVGTRDKPNEAYATSEFLKFDDLGMRRGVIDEVGTESPVSISRSTFLTASGLGLGASGAADTLKGSLLLLTSMLPSNRLCAGDSGGIVPIRLLP
jgi:hypothetical protein